MTRAALSFRFDYRRLGRELNGHIANALSAIGSSDSYSYSPVFSILGKALCWSFEEFVFVPLYRNSRPLGRRMLVVSAGSGTYWDPGVRNEDYLEVASSLSIDNDCSAVAYHEVVRFDFAAVEKSSMPVPISDGEVAQRYGLSLGSAERALLGEGKTLWWQAWGGILYFCEFSNGYPRVVTSWAMVQRGIGYRKRLPTSLAR